MNLELADIPFVLSFYALSFNFTEEICDTMFPPFPPFTD